jgi:hypothetical protein
MIRTQNNTFKITETLTQTVHVKTDQNMYVYTWSKFQWSKYQPLLKDQ